MLAVAGRLGAMSQFEAAELSMYLGLGLIAVGSGGIKPCVSANVGDQFGDHATLHFLTVKGQFRGAANMVFTLPQSTA